jgi:alkylation response protein AidB-like acyl-CoA dehydrogenase
VLLAETSEQHQLRAELRNYFTGLMAQEGRGGAGEAGVGGEQFRDIVRTLGRDGWLGIGWPTEYGGQGRSLEDQFIFFDEVQRAAVPFPFVTVNTVGPTLMKFGTDEQRRRLLPGILSGDIVFAIGYTEPDAGTDLASLRTRAVRDGDEWIVNGTKVFTSGANTADYIWLACRTGDAPRHKGISILIVPTDAEGFSWSPIPTVGGLTVTTTYYASVRVPADNMVGEVDGGWPLITSQLNHERIGLAAIGGHAEALWEKTLRWARSSGRMDLDWVRTDLARTHAKLEAMRLLNWKMTAAVAAGELRGADAAAAKVYGTETHIDVYQTLLGVLGPSGRIRSDGTGAELAGEVEQMSRQSTVNTFGGGVNEVLRDMIASQGLGAVAPRRAPVDTGGHRKGRD